MIDSERFAAQQAAADSSRKVAIKQGMMVNNREGGSQTQQRNFAAGQSVTNSPTGSFAL